MDPWMPIAPKTNYNLHKNANSAKIFLHAIIGDFDILVRRAFTSYIFHQPKIVTNKPIINMIHLSNRNFPSVCPIHHR